MAAHGFHYANDQLLIDKVPVGKVIERLSAPSTPFILYSLGQFRSNVETYQRALEKLAPSRSRLSYSMKANFNPHLLAILQSSNVMLTTVSGGEVQLALASGFDPSNIIFNGNGKTDESIRMAVEAGVLLNVDSEFDLEQIIACAQQLNKMARVLIRVNPLVSDPHVHAYNTTAAKTSKFGTSILELESVYKIIEENSDRWVCLYGFHCHLGSTISNTQIVAECVQVLMTLLNEKRFPHLRFLNIGGGLNIDYYRYGQRTVENPDQFKQTSIPSIDDYVQAIRIPLQTLSPSIELIVEPGRSLVANTCVLVTRVLGQKQTGPIRQLVVDASMTECIRPALYQAYHHIDTINPLSISEPRIPFDIVGPVCESGDFLGKQRCLPGSLKRGDFLAIFDTGAYCSSMSSNYNMRPKPAEYALDEQEQIKLLRRQDTNEDLLRAYCMQ